ncbi:hypothetical protein GCM10022280_08960 [Sphingomonas swuensis]|uniref:Fimbrial protein n=2 Tax=Sphingomonas swuensis TaxID=977800 RepID=A0ABP7SKP3_9SPHN
MRAVAFRALPLLLLAFAAPSMAATNVSVPTDLVPSLRYEVRGVIVPACTFAQGARDQSIVGLANPADDTVRAVRIDLPFTVQCNSPVRVAMVSNNGGLKHVGPGTSDPAFAGLVPYNAVVNLPNGGAALSCSSQAMAVEQAACSGRTSEPVAAGRGHIAVSVPAQDRLLLAGRYQDQVTLTLTPLLGGENGS